MSLINCKECGGKVSDKAKACPHCGIQLKHPVALFCIIVVPFIFAIGGLILGVNLWNSLLGVVFSWSGWMLGFFLVDDAYSLINPSYGPKHKKRNKVFIVLLYGSVGAIIWWVIYALTN
jgi:hypothetical protein